jgi:hypothetical protein
MRKFQVMSGQAMAVAASLLLVVACGGGSDEVGGTTDTTDSTQSTTTTTTVSSSTTTTQQGQVFASSVRFLHQNEGMALKEENGTAILTSTFYDTGDDGAKWLVTQYGEEFTIQNTTTNQCLAIQDASTVNGAMAVTAECGTPGTRWKMPQAGTSTNYNLINAATNKCLELNSDNRATMQLSQWDCGAVQPQGNQSWNRVILAQ